MHQRMIRVCAVACSVACALMSSPSVLGHARAEGQPQDAGGVQETGRSQALAALEQQVRAAADQIRMDLDAAESGTDYQPLLARKITVDTSLLAAWLLEDAQLLVRAVDAGIPPPPMLRGLCAEHSQDAWTQQWSHDPRVVADALRAWAGQESVAAAARSTAHRGAAGDAAPLIQWVVQSTCQPTPQVTALAAWCEPCLAAQWLDWPLDPTGLTVEWSGERCLVRTAEGQDAAEAWPAATAPFCNPPELYCVADALRAQERGAPALVAVEPWEGAAAPTPAGEDAHIVVRTVRRQDGSMVRTERWVLSHGALRWLLLEQGPLRLMHAATQAVEIVEEVPGQAARSVEHRAQSALAHPPGGMRVVISFRSQPRAGAAGQEGACAVPEVIRVYASGALCADITLSAVFAGSAAEASAASAAWALQESQRAAQRLHTRSAVFAAAAAGDAPLVVEILRTAAGSADEDGVPWAWTAANASAASALLAQGGFADAAASVARQAWLPALVGLPAPERTQAMAWALQHRVPLLPEMLQPPLAAALRAALEEQHSPAVGAAKPDAPAPPMVCDEPASGTPAAAVLEGIRAALETVPALSPEERAALGQAACAALAAASSGGQRHDHWPEGAVVSADLQAALQDEGLAPLHTPALFAQRVHAAAAAGWVTSEARHAAQLQVAQLAEALEDACHALAAQGILTQMEVSALARTCRARAAALAHRVGNPFLPAWRAVVDGAASLPSASALAAQVAADPLLAGQLRSLPRLAQLLARIRPDMQPAALEQRQADALVQAWMRAILQAGRQQAVGKPVGRSAEAPIVRLKEAPP